MNYSGKTGESLLLKFKELSRFHLLRPLSYPFSYNLGNCRLVGGTAVYLYPITYNVKRQEMMRQDLTMVDSAPPNLGQIEILRRIYV